ncbi:MAG: 30S ribosomal protein S9 [Pirellulaceae bacterium]|nr:30S ribosomal protein S9 [Pirellulaceae bacterium]
MVATKKDSITGECLGTGRRKSSVARVRIKAGTGKIQINGRSFEEYFVNVAERRAVLQTLDHVGQRESVDVKASVSGGGTIGQAGAVRMGLARALCGMNEEHFAPLRADGFLTRDSRMKERKKYGLRGARRGVQFSKR